jgi:hypothetical protein
VCFEYWIALFSPVPEIFCTILVNNEKWISKTVVYKNALS